MSLKSGDRNLLQRRVIMTFLSRDCAFMASLVPGEEWSLDSFPRGVTAAEN